MPILYCNIKYFVINSRYTNYRNSRHQSIAIVDNDDVMNMFKEVIESGYDAWELQVSW